jgi:hypothetical protein
MTKVEAAAAFARADAAWSAELKLLFGKRAGDVRYTAQGRGTPGTTLRVRYENREAARLAWEAAKAEPKRQGPTLQELEEEVERYTHLVAEFPEEQRYHEELVAFRARVAQAWAEIEGSKTYFHVFASNTRHGADAVWFHEASRDTRYDANDDRDGLKRDGYRVKIVRSAENPLRLLAALNA